MRRGSLQGERAVTHRVRGADRSIASGCMEFIEKQDCACGKRCVNTACACRHRCGSTRRRTRRKRWTSLLLYACSPTLLRPRNAQFYSAFRRFLASSPVSSLFSFSRFPSNSVAAGRRRRNHFRLLKIPDERAARTGASSHIVRKREYFCCKAARHAAGEIFPIG